MQIFVPWRIINQLVAALTATIGGLGIGLMLTWPLTALPNIIKRKDISDMNNDSVIWIASTALLGSAVAAFPTGIAMEIFGCKMVFMLCSVVIFSGWMAVAASTSVASLISGRFLIGLGAGGYSLSIPMYLGEIASKDLRGTLGSLFSLQISTGICLSCITGSHLSWIWLSCLCAIVPVIHFTSLLFLPDSPIDLLSRNKPRKAMMSLQYLRGQDKTKLTRAEIQEEFENVCAQIEKRLRNSGQPFYRNPVCEPHVLKASRVPIIMMCFQQFNGVGVVLMYISSMEGFMSPGSNLEPNFSPVITSALQLVGVFLSTLIVDRIGRKVLLIASMVIVSFSCITLGSYFYVREHSDKSSLNRFEWLPSVCFIKYIVFYSSGIGPVAWTLLGEMLPHRIGITSAMVTFTHWLVSFILIKTTAHLFTSLGHCGFFWLLGGISAAACIFTFLFVPETKGKSLEDIHTKYYCSESDEIEMSRF